MEIKLFKIKQGLSINGLVSNIQSSKEIDLNDKKIIESEINFKDGSKDIRIKRKILVNSFVLKPDSNRGELRWSWLITKKGIHIPDELMKQVYDNSGGEIDFDELGKGLESQTNEPYVKNERNEDLLVIVTIVDDEFIKRHYVINFGYSAGLIDDYIDEEFPFEFISQFETSNFKTTYVRFPFSVTNKTLSGHTNMSEYHSRFGSYLAQVDLDLTGIPKSISSMLNDSKSHSAKECLSFVMKKSKDIDEMYENLMNYVTYVDYISETKKVENKYEILKRVSKKDAERIRESVFDDADIETKTSIAGLAKNEIGGFETYIDITECEIKFDGKKSISDYIKRNGIRIPRKISDRTLDEIKAIYENNKTISDSYKNPFEFIKSFKLYNDAFFIGSVTKFTEMIIKIGEKQYIMTDGKIFEPKKEFTEMMKKPLESLNQISYAFPSTELNVENLISELNIRTNDLKNEGDSKCPRLYYQEIMFNYALTNFLNSDFSLNDSKKSVQKYYSEIFGCNSSLLLDRKIAKNSSVEISDIVFMKNSPENNEKNISFAHVKFGLTNQSLSYNIDQSIASINLIESRNADAIKLIEESNGNFTIDDITQYEIIIALKTKEYNSLVRDGKVDWKRLKSRTISKFKLMEWAYIVGSTSKKPAIKVIEVKSDYEDWKLIVDPEKQLKWVKDKDVK